MPTPWPKPRPSMTRTGTAAAGLAVGTPNVPPTSAARRNTRRHTSPSKRAWAGEGTRRRLTVRFNAGQGADTERVNARQVAGCLEHKMHDYRPALPDVQLRLLRTE